MNEENLSNKGLPYDLMLFHCYSILFDDVM